MIDPAVRDAAAVRHEPCTVGAYALELRRTPEALIAQLREAGVDKASAADPLTDQDKQQLLGHLQASHGCSGSPRKRITLVKRSSPSTSQRFPSSKMLVVGGLGRFDYEQADEKGQGLLDAYERYARMVCARLLGARRPGDLSFREVCRLLTRTFKRLRRSVSRVLFDEPTLDLIACGSARRTGAFFHMLKVDGRNAP